MDTIVLLEGEIGRENLSTQSKKRISNYNSLKKQVATLKNAYENASKEDKENYKKELEEGEDYLNEYSINTESFLKDELADLTAKNKIKADKKAKKEEEDKIKAEEKANGTPKEKKEEGGGIGGFILGAVVLVATLGAVNYFKNN